MELLSDHEINEDRRDAVDNMRDWCRITRPGPGGKGPINPVTLEYDQPPARVVVYQGRCRIQVKADINSNVVETTAGDREATYQTFTLGVPITAVPAAPGDPFETVGTPEAVRPDYIAEIIHAPNDPSLLGRLFNIQGMYHKSQASHRRWRVRQVVA